MAGITGRDDVVMTVTARHVSQHPSATVVRGLDSAAAVSHLCRSLEAGTGFEDPIVVLDLRRKPAVAAECAAALRQATTVLRRSQRWLAVVDGAVHRVEVDDPPTFGTTKDAIRSGQRYFRLVTGSRPPLLEIRFVTSAVMTLASATVAVAHVPARAGLRLLASLTRSGPG